MLTEQRKHFSETFIVWNDKINVPLKNEAPVLNLGAIFEYCRLAIWS